MKKLLDKNELAFSLILIAVYVVGSGIMKDISSSVGAEFAAETVFNFVFSLIIFIFIKKNSLYEHLCLQKPKVPFGKMLFYIPLILIPFFGIGFGTKFEYTGTALLFHTVAMFFAGFIEEIIFRGFLFNGIAKKNTKRAVIITSLTFGIGHIVNLLNGYELFDNLIQIVYAVGCGFMLAMILIRTESIFPCIVFHILNNILTGFVAVDRLAETVGSESKAMLVVTAVRFVVMTAYTVYIIKAVNSNKAGAETEISQ